MLGARNASDVAAGCGASQGQTPEVSAWCVVPSGAGFPTCSRGGFSMPSAILTLDPLCHNRIHPSPTPISVVNSFPAHEWVRVSQMYLSGSHLRGAQKECEEADIAGVPWVSLGEPSSPSSSSPKINQKFSTENTRTSWPA